jgi:hypothetical protein
LAWPGFGVIGIFFPFLFIFPRFCVCVCVGEPGVISQLSWYMNLQQFMCVMLWTHICLTHASPAFCNLCYVLYQMCKLVIDLAEFFIELASRFFFMHPNLAIVRSLFVVRFLPTVSQWFIVFCFVRASLFAFYPSHQQKKIGFQLFSW